MSFTSPDSKETVSEPAKQALREVEDEVGLVTAGFWAPASEEVTVMYSLSFLVQLPIVYFSDVLRVLHVPSEYWEYVTVDPVMKVAALDQIALGCSDCEEKRREEEQLQS
jgi:hypothetical protein